MYLNWLIQDLKEWRRAREAVRRLEVMQGEPKSRECLELLASSQNAQMLNQEACSCVGIVYILYILSVISRPSNEPC